MNQPTLHLHLLKRCNLACAHCYSDSGPGEREMLSATQAVAAIDLAAHWGCRNVSVSGGEPLLHPALGAVLAHARGLGLHTAVVSNGLLLQRPAAMAAASLADTLCISVDGLDAAHDRMRGREGALRQLRRVMDLLARAGRRFSVSCGVLRDNLDEIDGVAELARAHGAVALQLHAVEAAGRGRALAGCLLDDDEQALLYVAAQVLRDQYAGCMEVHVDLLPLELLLDEPARIHAASPAAGATPMEELGVLVLESDGTLVPACHGLHRSHALGHLSALLALGADRAWQQYAATGLPALRSLGRAAMQGLRERAPAVVNPAEALSAAADCLTERLAPVPARAARYFVPKMRSPASPSPGTM